MTAAEKLEQRGIDKGIEQGIEKAALNLLREGADVEFIAKITGLPESRILELAQTL